MDKYFLFNKKKRYRFMLCPFDRTNIFEKCAPSDFLKYLAFPYHFFSCGIFSSTCVQPHKTVKNSLESDKWKYFQSGKHKKKTWNSPKQPVFKREEIPHGKIAKAENKIQYDECVGEVENNMLEDKMEIGSSVWFQKAIHQSFSIEMIGILTS